MCVELMTGTTFVDVSDSMSVVEPPTQTRMSGQGYVLGEDVALTTHGKLEPTSVTVRGMWAQGTADPFYDIYLAHTTPCGALAAIRWAIAGCATSSDAFSTNTTRSKVENLVYPAGDSEDANPVFYQFVIRTPDLLRAAWS